jgi:tetratricopeptide (TPR) repeat protein
MDEKEESASAAEPNANNGNGQAGSAAANPASAHNDMGAEFERMGRFEAAADCYKRAVQLAPDDAESHNNLGTVLAKMGRSEEARAAFEKVLSLNPRHANALNNLGIVLAQLDHADEAIVFYRRALAIRPDHANAYQNMGNAFLKLELAEEAADAYRKCLAIVPRHYRVQYSLGNAYARMGKLEEAMAAYEAALELNPGFAEAHHGIGNALQQLGKIDQAGRHFEKALALRPDFAPAYDALSRQKKIEDEGESADSLEKLLARKNLPAGERCSALFALGRIYEDRGDFERSFENYRLGNETMREEFDLRKHVEFVNELIETFTPELFKKCAAMGDPSEKPIFIIGMIRSGTTLVEQIISSHPSVFGAGELDDVKNIARIMPRILKSKKMFPECMAESNAAGLREAAKIYLDAITKMSGGEPYVTDKMPGNFFHAGLIRMMFPNACIIHTKRDPLDNCLSAYFNKFQTGQQFSYDLNFLGQYYRQYARLMDHWRKVLPKPILEVQYEELVENQEKISRKILQFCGLEWDDRCLEFHKNERPIRTASSWQVRQPMYTSSVDRWRPYAKPLQPLITALGDLAPAEARTTNTPSDAKAPRARA